MERGVVRLKNHRRVWLAVPGALAALGIGVSAALMLAPSPAPVAPAYLLKDHGGKLALYAADGGGPLEEYDIYTRLLPEQDVLALQQGVPVADAAELQRRLEDYGY